MERTLKTNTIFNVKNRLKLLLIILLVVLISTTGYLISRNAFSSPDYEYFNEKTLDGMTVKIIGKKNKIPDDTKLSIVKVNKKVKDSVDESIEQIKKKNVNVVDSYTYDIKLLDSKGKEIELDEEIKIVFENNKILNKNLDVSVYHTTEGDLETEKLNGRIQGDSIVAKTDSFSYYTVEFTYGDLIYSIEGEQTIEIDEILSNIGLTGEISDVQVSNEELLSIEKKNNKWYLTTSVAFSSTELMKVTIDGIVYEITVTDDLVGEAYAVLENDGDFIFFRSEESYTNDTTGTFTDVSNNSYTGRVFAGFESLSGEGRNNSLWKDYASSIETVTVAPGQTIIPKDISFWFYNCTNLKSVDFSGISSLFIAKMVATFWKCTALEILDIHTLKTCSDISNMQGMLCGLDSLKNIRLGDNITFNSATVSVPTFNVNLSYTNYSGISGGIRDLEGNDVTGPLISEQTYNIWAYAPDGDSTGEIDDISMEETDGYSLYDVVTGKGNGSAKITVGYTNATVKIDGKDGTCVTAGTLITMADGSKVPIEKLKGGDEVLAWDFETGKYVSTPIMFIEPEEKAEFDIIHLFFEDDIDVETSFEHGFFDYTLGKYIYINEDNPERYIGHKFIMQDGKKYKTVELIDIKHEKKETAVYGMTTYKYFNFFNNDMLSISGNISGMFNYFDVDLNTMRYDQDKKNKDIENYGLLTYDELVGYTGDLISKMEFEAYNAQYLKVSVGKGLTTWDGIKALAERYGSSAESSSDTDDVPIENKNRIVVFPEKYEKFVKNNSYINNTEKIESITEKATKANYVVKFTYGVNKYAMDGNSTMTLSEVLKAINIKGEPEEVKVSNSNLVSVFKKYDKWRVSANKAFESEEWMKVIIDGKTYDITVTDDASTRTWTRYADLDGNYVSTGPTITGIQNYDPSYPGWYGDTNTITFNPNGGQFQNTTSTSTKTVSYGSNQNYNPGVATRSGYIFAGWYTQATGGVQVFDSTGVSVVGTYWNSDNQYIYQDDLLVYAHWADGTPPTVQDIGGGTSLKATSQSLTLKCSDNVAVTAYYWGTTEPTSASAMTTTTSTDITALASSSGLSKSVNAAGTYYLGCRDAVGNWAKKSIIIRKYQVQSVLEKIAGVRGTYTSTNYETTGSASTYYVKSGTTLTLSSIYTAPTGASSSTFKGYTMTAPTTSAATPSTTSPTVASNGTTVYYMWFDRTTYAVTVTKHANGSIKAETVTQTGNSVTVAAGASSNGTLTVKYGDTVKATATASTGYSFTGWSGGYISGSTNPTTGASVTAAKTITASFGPNTYTITLDNKDATTAGTTAIYEKYATGYYLDSNATTQMTTSVNGITVPEKTGYTFDGYYTSASDGTKYIDATGKLTSNASSTNFSANGTLYAHWSRGLLSISEKVEGNQADTSKEFSFTINVKDTSGNNISGTYAYTGSKSGDLTFTSGNATFTLHHDQYIEMYFPTGYTYTITQDSDGYTLTKTNDTGSIGGNGSAKDAVFTDTLDELAPTGLFLDILPYFILLIISVFSMIIMYKLRVNKKKAI